MTSSRTALLSTAVVAATGLALTLTARSTPAATAAACGDGEATALAQLAKLAQTAGSKIVSGTVTYTHVGPTVLAHAPLDSINQLTADDLARGAAIMAIYVHGDPEGRVPDGAYVIRAEFAPGADHGKVTYLDAAGAPVATVDALMRDRAQINDVFPGTYDDPPTPSNLPVITSTHVWHNNHWAVDCTGPGWNWKVIYY